MKWKLETPIGRYRAYENPKNKWIAEYPYIGISGKGDPIIHIARVECDSEEEAISHCNLMWSDIVDKINRIKC